MGQKEKALYFNALREAGQEFDQHYRHYKEADLKVLWEKLPEDQRQPVAYTQESESEGPVKSNEPLDTLAGVRMNSDTHEIIRIDDEGRQWLQEEIRKSAIPKPRVRRKYQYQDSGTKEMTVRNGEYMETFEVAGGDNNISEARVTLPTYQVGRYVDPRFPFSVHIYNEQRGFDLFEVEEFYGGRELVPPTVKRIYVDSVLCYDIESVIQAVEAEYRRLALSRQGEFHV